MRPRPLKLDTVTEKRAGNLILRYPFAHEDVADRAIGVLQALIPVVERYLGVALEGQMRLDLLEEARFSGVNPATGVLRHAVRGFQERSPRTAGLLSYQLGKILWYRGTREAAFTDREPRVPLWLHEAALLPLLHIWSDRCSWLDFLAEQVGLFAWHKPLPVAELSRLEELSPLLKPRALAQCLLRGQSLWQRHHDWVRGFCRLLGENPSRGGLELLEQFTGFALEAWEERFTADLEAWRRSAGGIDADFGFD